MSDNELGQAEAEFHARMIFCGMEMFVKENHQKLHENLWYKGAKTTARNYSRSWIPRNCNEITLVR